MSKSTKSERLVLWLAGLAIGLLALTFVVGLLFVAFFVAVP